MSFNLDEPAIYLITSGEATPANFVQTSRQILDIVRVAVDENVSLVQLREKRLSARLVFELAVKLAEITRGTSTRLLVNDRADIAVAAKADGVHLTASSLSTKIIRTSFPSDLVVGVSTHTIDAARTAAEQGADFAVFAPVFETPGKGEPQGLERLTNICSELRPFPVIALGGVDETNYRVVIEAGASGFAAIRSLTNPRKLRAVARDLRNHRNEK